MSDLDRIFIPTHGRAGNNTTLKLLRSVYHDTHPITLVIDESESPSMYHKEMRAYSCVDVIQFDRRQITVDTMRCSDDIRLDAVVYARHYIDQYAREQNLRYYAVFDDDYNQLGARRYPLPDGHAQYVHEPTGWYSFIRDAIELLETDQRIAAVAASQGGDVFQAYDVMCYMSLIRRKVMNSFVFCTDRPALDWRGLANEDTNAYITEALRGRLCITLGIYQIVQRNTQQRDGGLTPLYRALGTAWKSWTSCAVYPAGVSLGLIGGKCNQRWRIHHKMDWAHLCPCIISDRWQHGSNH